MAIRGRIDGFDGFTLFGWIYDPTQDGPFVIDITIDGLPFAQGVKADLFRDDLLRAGMSDGHRAFQVAVPALPREGDVLFAVHLNENPSPLFTRSYNVDAIFSRIEAITHCIVSGFVMRRSDDDIKKPVDIALRLGSIYLPTTQARAGAKDNNRLRFSQDLNTLDHPTRNMILGYLETAYETDDPGLPTFAVCRVIDGKPGADEAIREISVEEIADLIQALEPPNRKAFRNALLFRKALETRGLWLGTPLTETEIEGARHDPAALCVDPVHFHKTIPASTSSDVAISNIELFRVLAHNHDVTPNLLFSETWYRRHQKGITQALIAGAASGLDHYLDKGLDDGVFPHEAIVTGKHVPATLGRDFLKWMVSDGQTDMPEGLTFLGSVTASWDDFIKHLTNPIRPNRVDWSSQIQGNLAGKDWVLINTNTHTRNIHITRAILDDARSLFGRGKVHMASYDNVVDLCTRLDDPVLLCLDGQRINLSILERAISSCSSAALWTFDDPYNLTSHLKIMELFDMIFTNDESCRAAYGEKGFYLPLAAASSLIETAVAPAPAFDVFFCGTAWPNRVTLLNRLMRDRPDLRFKVALTYNAAVPPLPLVAPISSYLQSLSFADYIGYAQRSRVTLSLHRSFSGTDVLESSSNPGPRVFEIGAAGAYQISESGGDGFKALFPDQELGYFDSYDELVALVDAAIADPEACRKAAGILRNRIATRHTYRHRLITIAEEMGRMVTARPPLALVAPRQRPRLLYVVHNTIRNPPFGGLEVHQDVLAQNLKDRYEIFFFYTVNEVQKGRRGILADCNYQELEISDNPTSFGHENLQNPDLEKFFSLCLSKFDFDLVHFFQFMHGTPSLAHIVRSHGIPYGVSLHDFYTACREHNLLDHNGRFCQNDRTKLFDCDICLKKRFKFPNKSQQIRRDYFGDILSRADTLMFVSRSTKEIHEGIYPQLAMAGARRVHGAPIPNSQWPIARSIRLKKPIGDRIPRFLILGNLNEHKGGTYLLDALEACSDFQAEFHFHGSISDTIKQRYQDALKHQAVFHGRYSPGTLDLSVYDFSLHLSIWPETYCQTLSEAWAASVVPIVSDIGALGQRVSHGVNGYKVDPGRPATLTKLLMEIGADPEKHLAVRAKINDDLFMDQSQHSRLYDEAYREVLDRRINTVRHPMRRVEGVKSGATLEVLQRRGRTAFWSKGRGGHPKVEDHLPSLDLLQSLRQIEPFSGRIVRAGRSSFDRVANQPVMSVQDQVIIMKNMQNVSLRGWVENTGMCQPQPVALLLTEERAYTHPLKPELRRDVAEALEEPAAAGWGMIGSIRILTPDMMLAGLVTVAVGWLDREADLLTISRSTIKVMGKFGA